MNPNKREAAHLAAGNAFERLHNEARVFWSVDCLLEKSDVVLSNKLRDMIDRKSDLNGKSPQIPKWAYQKAKAGIEAGEAEFKVDANRASPTPAPAALPPPAEEPPTGPQPHA